MKKVAKLMEELGFKESGSDEVKKAFVKNLINQAAKLEPQTKVEQKKQKSREPLQLSMFPPQD